MGAHDQGELAYKHLRRVEAPLGLYGEFLGFGENVCVLDTEVKPFPFVASLFKEWDQLGDGAALGAGAREQADVLVAELQDRLDAEEGACPGLYLGDATAAGKLFEGVDDGEHAHVGHGAVGAGDDGGQVSALSGGAGGLKDDEALGHCGGLGV